MRKRKAALAAAGCLIGLWGVGTPGIIAQAAPLKAATFAAATADCNFVKDAQYWLCKALEASDCNLAERSDYWLCRGLTERNCNLVNQGDYWFCSGMTQSNCNLVDRSDYWLCKGLTEDCDLAERDDRLKCEAFSPFFRRSAS